VYPNPIVDNSQSSPIKPCAKCEMSVRAIVLALQLVVVTNCYKRSKVIELKRGDKIVFHQNKNLTWYDGKSRFDGGLQQISHRVNTSVLADI